MIQLFELLSQVNAQLMKSVVPAVKEENMSIMEVMILMRIYKKGPHKTTDLAKDVAVPPSTFTGITDRLVSRGYLTRANTPEDRRSVVLEGTQELKKLVEHIMSVCDERLTEILKDLPEEFIEQMTKNLQTLREYLIQKNEEGASNGSCQFKADKSQK